MRFLDFDAARSEAVREPVALQIGGERFELLPAAPAAAMFDLAATGLSGTACKQFLEAVLVDDDLERFAKILAAKTDPVSVDDLIDVTRRLVEVYTGRPTRPSTGSPDGRSGTGATSTGPSSSPEGATSSP